MAGKVLLVDDVSTNRIILKVKLSAAYCNVIQAASIAEARAVIATDRPDLILVSGHLAAWDAAAQLAGKGPDTAPSGRPAFDIPIVLLTKVRDKAFRMKALGSGAAEVIGSPANETFLLARLRSLLRRQKQADDLPGYKITSQALGFAEGQTSFSLPALISLITDNPIAGRRLTAALGPFLAHRMQVAGVEQLRKPISAKAPSPHRSDLMIADLRGYKREDTVRRMADLNTMMAGQGCPVLPLLESGAEDMAATLLDIGAQDVLLEDMLPDEMALRINAQLDLKRAREQMRHQIKDSLKAAMTDPLTGLYNRRYALSFLKRLLSENDNAGRSFAVMVADLDHFKLINDTYGHGAGDQVLAHVAKTLSASLRAQDLVARIGGEEFLIITPDVTRQHAHRIAQDLCEAVASMALILPGHRRPITVTTSIGVTIASLASKSGINSDMETRNLLELADRALYTSKAEGRNTVTFSEKSAA